MSVYQNNTSKYIRKSSICSEERNQYIQKARKKMKIQLLKQKYD